MPIAPMPIAPIKRSTAWRTALIAVALVVVNLAWCCWAAVAADDALPTAENSESVAPPPAPDPPRPPVPPREEVEAPVAGVADVPLEQPPAPALPDPALPGPALPEPRLLEGRLPWEAESHVDPLPGQQLTGARQMLEMLGVDASHWRRFVDGQPFAADEEEPLYRVLFRLPQMTLVDIERWQHNEFDPLELARDPEPWRVETFLLKGRARRVERVAVIPESAELYEFDHYWRIELTLDIAEQPAVVFVREIPEAWRTAEEIDERVRISALFLKVGADDNSPPPLIFAARRVGWFPEQPRPEWRVGPELVFLASLGFDASLIEPVRRRNGAGIGVADRESFYQMLAAARRTTPAEVAARAAPETTLEALIQPTPMLHGAPAVLRGAARRVTKIVCDPDIRKRFGLEHYYQIDLFVPLDRHVRIGTAEEGGPLFEDAFPVTVCVAKLPKDLPVDNDMNEQIEVAGFFFKNWSYRTEFARQFGPDRVQISPLLIGREVRHIDIAAPRPLWVTLAVAGVFVAGVLGSWVWVWLSMRGDTQFERTTLRRLEQSSAPEVGDLPGDVSGEALPAALSDDQPDDQPDATGEAPAADRNVT